MGRYHFIPASWARELGWSPQHFYRGKVLVTYAGQWHSRPHPVIHQGLDVKAVRETRDFDPDRGFWWPDVVIYPAEGGGYAVKCRTSQGTAGPFKYLKDARDYLNKEEN